jgi:hydroxyacylglutathione hydrolase
MSLDVHQFPCLDDNYGVLIHDRESGATASIDAPDAACVEKALAETGWRLTHILVTHHHRDHTDGNLPLEAKWHCRIVGNRADRHRIPGIDETVEAGGTYDFAGHLARIIDTPGHTRGHIAWHFADDGLLFAGDTLFALGCGRVFEGSMEEMWGSLSRLAALPGETRVYCGHEYTLANARYALHADPGNPALVARMKVIEDLRRDGRPTLPTTIARERETNPFLRAGSPERFAELRRGKDSFRG